MAKKTTKSAAKKKKKIWYNILAPKMFGERVIGTTPAYDAVDLRSRILQINLNELTNDHKHQSLKAFLSIVDAKSNNALTEIVGFEMNPSPLKRAIRKQRSRGDISKIYEISGDKVRMKVLVVTRKKASASIIRDIRKAIDDQLTPELKNMNYEDILSSLVMKKLQFELKKSANKIYPLTFCEVRYFRKV